MDNLDIIKNVKEITETNSIQAIEQLIREKEDLISEDKGLLDNYGKNGIFPILEVKVGSSSVNLWDVTMNATIEEKYKICTIVNDIILRQFERQSQILSLLNKHVTEVENK